MADVLDNQIDKHHRERLWNLIRSTPRLTWQLVTKRIGNAPKMLPADWGAGYPNVWLLSTVVNQEEADRGIPKLLAVPAVVHGFSVKPQLAAIEISHYAHGDSFATRPMRCGRFGILYEAGGHPADRHHGDHRHG